ncbi:MAG: STAS domain-containing protein [Hydrogenovibrio sp.]|nr:STAS domain-containing protein [Hydrogenovibrio sp.]
MVGVKSKVHDQNVNIEISGNFDISYYDDFNRTINENLETASRFVIDLAQATYMDSSALGMLLMLREKTHSDASRVELVNVNDDVMKILKVAKFEQLFSINP